jgi:hypothetical protein
MRAGYRSAIQWIAENDSCADPGNMDPKVVSELVTSCMVADIFNVSNERVGEDVVKYRKKANKEKASAVLTGQVVP